jgi:hypothetical protein
VAGNVGNCAFFMGIEPRETAMTHPTLLALINANLALRLMLALENPKYADMPGPVVVAGPTKREEKST